MNRPSTCHMCCGAGGGIAAIALLLWLGVPAAVSIVSAIGFRVPVVSPWVVPVIIGALGLVTVGLWLGVKSHSRAEPLMVGLVGSVATVIGVLVWSPIALLGFATVAGAILWNQRLLRLRAQFEATQ